MKKDEEENEEGDEKRNEKGNRGIPWHLLI